MDDTPHQHFSNRGRQFGQSSVFVIVFLGITILSLVFLYKAGKLTSEKMELQNAADGVAYSVAILEARDLNFMAYTNRAMVANEVAIGQAVGLASWPRHWESIGYYENNLCGSKIEPLGVFLTDIVNPAIDGVGQGLSAIPVAGAVLNQVVQKVADAVEKMGEAMGENCENIRDGTDEDFIIRGQNLAGEVDDNIAIPLAQLMEAANQGLSDAQAIFHLGTMAYVTETVGQVTRDNVNDGDTGLSPYGFAALLGHLMTFGHLAPFGTTLEQRYGPDLNRQDRPFIRTHRPDSSEPADRTGFERFAAITGAARDEFGKGPRRWAAKPDFQEPQITWGPEIPLGACPGTVATLCFGWLKFELNIGHGLATPIDHRAGSELHHVGAGRGDQYNWSSGETSSGSVGYFFSASFSIEYAPPSTSGPSYDQDPLLETGGSVGISTGGLDLYMGLSFTIPGLDPIVLPPINLNVGGGILPGMPFGAGAAQINSGLTNYIGDLPPAVDNTISLYPLPGAQVIGLPGSDYYGDAPGGNLVGSSVAPANKLAHAAAWQGKPFIDIPFLMTPWQGPFDPSLCPVNEFPVPFPCPVPIVSGTPLLPPPSLGWMPFKNVGGLFGGIAPGGPYSGLKQYSDTTEARDLWGFQGPHIIIALQKSIANLFSATAPQPTGQFELTEFEPTNPDNKVIGAIAKGEVYFKRPSDMDLFRRWDTPSSPLSNSATRFEEYGSAFNPYWQARLAPLSHADRAVATAQQHGQDLESGNTANQTITASWDLDTWIP
jgi:Putative Flp pilus-assembly TadE/G-like